MSDAIVRDVEAFYNSYLDAFNRRDGDAFVGSFSYPSALLSSEHGMVLHAEASDARRFFDGAIATLAAIGWDHSDVDLVQVWPYAETLAMIIADIKRCKADGSVFDRGRACYMVRREPDGWRIVTLTEMKPPYADQRVEIG
jgi:ketosteroid isomerase-like protein